MWHLLGSFLEKNLSPSNFEKRLLHLIMIDNFCGKMHYFTVPGTFCEILTVCPDWAD